MYKNRINIAGVNFDAVQYEDVLDAIKERIGREQKGGMIVTPNPEMLVYAQEDSLFKNILNSACFSVPDGIGILWAARYLNLPVSKNIFTEWLTMMKTLFEVLFKKPSIYRILPARVTGVDLLFKTVEKGQKEGWRIYLLGAAPGVGDIAIHNLLQKYPRAVFAGSFAGTPAESHEEELCQRINMAKPDILFVAYGSPAQEQWIHRNLSKLSTIKIAMGVGGAIDFAAGKAKRAPVLLINLGLEWMWRLLTEPHRFRRIWRATFVFVRMIFRIKTTQIHLN